MKFTKSAGRGRPDRRRAAARGLRWRWRPAGQQSSAAPSGPRPAAEAPIVVGSANFTESQIIAEIYSQALKAKGIESSTKLGIGSREVYIKALQDARSRSCPEYTGNLLLNFDKAARRRPPRRSRRRCPDALPTDLKVLKSSPAADQDVYVVTKEFSEQNGVTSLADLAKIADGRDGRRVLRAGEARVRPGRAREDLRRQGQAVQAVRLARGDGEELKKGNDRRRPTCSPRRARSAATAWSSWRIPKAMILPQNVIPLVRSEVAENATATAALDAVQAALTTEELTALNYKVDDRPAGSGPGRRGVVEEQGSRLICGVSVGCRLGGASCVRPRRARCRTARIRAAAGPTCC